MGLSLLQLASWQSWLQALPSLRGWHTETLAAIAPRDETEVRVGLAGLLSLVLGIGTLIAVQVHGALVFALPALALGHWCLHARAERPTLEARWLATLGLIITYSWLLLFTVGVVVLALRSGR